MDNMASSDVERITVKSSVEPGMSSVHGSSKRDSLDTGKSGRVKCILGVELSADTRMVDDAESDMSMRYNLDGSLNDTVGKLKSNNRLCSDSDTYDGRLIGSLDDTAGRLDDSLSSDTGRLNNSQGSYSDMHAGGLNTSLGNGCSDAGRLNDS